MNTAQDQSVVQNAQQNPPKTDVQMQPPVAPPPGGLPTPISGPQKEAEPLSISQNTQEYITPSEIEPVIAPEVAEHGVETVTNQHVPQLTPEHKALGIEHAKETVQVVTVPTGQVQLPMTVEEATVTVKQQKVSNSIVWIAALVLKHAKLVHEKLIQSKN